MNFTLFYIKYLIHGTDDVACNYTAFLDDNLWITDWISWYQLSGMVNVGLSGAR